MGTPNREPQEYSMNVIEYKDPGRYIPIIFLLYSCCSLFGVPIRVPLFRVQGSGRWGFPFAVPMIRIIVFWGSIFVEVPVVWEIPDYLGGQICRICCPLLGSR